MALRGGLARWPVEAGEPLEVRVHGGANGWGGAWSATVDSQARPVTVTTPGTDVVLTLDPMPPGRHYVTLRQEDGPNRLRGIAEVSAALVVTL